MPRVVVCWSPAPRQVLEEALELPPGATVREALLASAWAQGAVGTTAAQAEIGIWGRRCTPEHVLREGDRVEVYRALLVDPKLARRERFRKQGVRAAGLFAGKQPRARRGE